MYLTAEHQRLAEHRNRKANWKKWGPYLSERSWGTVREDYSTDGSAWEFFPHDHARSRAYRWGEDGIAGISDRYQYICFALALWNGNDPILKERMFGLTGSEGNHGEDVKEYYFYLDSTPTHSYMKMLYKYPQAAYPYSNLVSENRHRGFFDYEYELLDTGVFDGKRYFDVVIEYAKANWDDILVKITMVNRDRLIKTLKPMLDENEFLSKYGIRSVSRYHRENPYKFYVDGQSHTISYQPAESESGLFGGNSNWRGPIWFPINYLLIESLQKFNHYYADSLKVECPTGSGQMMTLGEVATELSRRLVQMFLRNGDSERPIYGGLKIFQHDQHWQDLILFNEYFHGDNGAGLGASHQTGWTGLVAKLIQQSGGWREEMD